MYIICILIYYTNALLVIVVKRYCTRWVINGLIMYFKVEINLDKRKPILNG